MHPWLIESKGGLTGKHSGRILGRIFWRILLSPPCGLPAKRILKNHPRQNPHTKNPKSAHGNPHKKISTHKNQHTQKSAHTHKKIRTQKSAYKNLHSVGIVRATFLTTSPKARLDHDPGWGREMGTGANWNTSSTDRKHVRLIFTGAPFPHPQEESTWNETIFQVLAGKSAQQKQVPKGWLRSRSGGVPPNLFMFIGLFSRPQFRRVTIRGAQPERKFASQRVLSGLCGVLFEGSGGSARPCGVLWGSTRFSEGIDPMLVTLQNCWSLGGWVSEYCFACGSRMRFHLRG